MCSRKRMFCLSLLSVVIFTAVSYGQIKGFSSVSSSGADKEIFDHTISMHRPWSEIVESDSSLKNQYEQVVRYWADGIYEMTNSAHKLGKVRIYTGSRFASSTDVQWVDTVMGGTGGPNAIINGFKRKGRIQMSDRFSDYRISIPDAGQDNWKGAGYMLAHESGHYVYSLLDEYAGSPSAKSKTIYDPLVGDTPVDPSIMNDQWRAVSVVGYRWLNFSTQNNIGDLSKTVQGRVHGADAWTVLTRNANEDPHAFTN